MEYHIVVDRRKQKPTWDGTTLTLPLAPGSKLWSRTNWPVAITKDLKASPEARDLLDIVSTLYYTDKYIPRGERELWCRTIKIKIGLRNLQKFEEIRTQLQFCLSVLSSDNIEFIPHQITEAREDKEPKYRRKWTPPNFTDIALLSGGQDSNTGARKLLSENKTTLFVRVNIQDGVSSSVLKTKIRAQSQSSQSFVFTQPIMALTTTTGPALAKESSQRMRSIFFLGIASAVASTYEANTIHINENGIMAIHLPLDPSRSSSFSTRTAYPLYLQTYQKVVSNWLSMKDLKVKNAFVLKTKTEVIQEAIKLGASDFVAKSVSCAHSSTIKRTVKNLKSKREYVEGNPRSLHCGYCFPCILRRISTYCAGLEDQDVKYVFNPFTLTLDTDTDDYQSIHEASSATLNLIKFIRLVDRSSDQELVMQYGQIAESMFALGLNSPKEIIDLHRRFSLEVKKYIQERAAHLLYLFDDTKSVEAEKEIRSIAQKDTLATALNKLGTYDWNDKFEEQIEMAFDTLRIHLQVALANKQVTTNDLKSTLEGLLKDSIPESTSTKKPTSLNNNDGIEARKKIVLGCKTKCWPLTKD